MAEHPAGNDASLGDLVHDLTEQTSRLVREEVALAKSELQASAKHAGVGAGLFGAAGVVALFGVGALVASAIGALALAMDVWAAALIVAAVLFAVAGVAALVGKKQVTRVGPPARTVRSVKQDVREIKEHRT